MHQFNFCWAPPQTPLRELTSLPRPVAVSKGPTSKRRKGNGVEEKSGGWDGMDRERR